MGTRTVAAVLALAAPLMACNNLIGTGDIEAEGADGANVGRAATPDDVAGGPQALNCAYSPDTANLGVGANKFLPSSVYWPTAFRPGTTDFSNPTTLNTTDLYDCNGSKGVHAVVYEVSKFF